MKILYITNNLDGKDGWSRYSLDIAKSLKEVDVLWLVAHRSENDFRQEAILFEPLQRVSNIFLIFAVARKVNSAIKNFSPDVIHFLVEPYLMILPFLDVKKAKVVCAVHGTYSFLPNTVKSRLKRIFLLWWIKFVYNRIDNIIAVSNFTKNYLIECLNNHRIKGVKEKIMVIGNGVDFNSFHSMCGEKEPRVTKQILFVGAVKRRKGLDEAINALKFYHDHFSGDFVFNIIGAFDEKDQYYLDLKSLISSYQLDDKITFRNKVEESALRDFYAKADLFLMLPVSDGNNFEGFGLVYLEASACGVPCLGSRYSGAEDAILDGKTGYLVEPHLAKDVADKIDLILNKKMIDSDVCVSWAKQNDTSIKIKELFEIYKTKNQINL